MCCLSHLPMTGWCLGIEFNRKKCAIRPGLSNFVTHHFCFQDKAQPETQALRFGDLNFNAVLAMDDPSALPLVKQPGSDGFRLDSTPLFQVSK